jgi:hypothetical protein
MLIRSSTISQDPISPTHSKHRPTTYIPTSTSNNVPIYPHRPHPSLNDYRYKTARCLLRRQLLPSRPAKMARYGCLLSTPPRLYRQSRLRLHPSRLRCDRHRGSHHRYIYRHPCQGDKRPIARQRCCYLRDKSSGLPHSTVRRPIY